MSTWVYLIEVSACTALFYLFYRLVLCRFTFFTLNRWYLLGTLLLSFAIPLLRLPGNVPVSPVAPDRVQQVFLRAKPLPVAVNPDVSSPGAVRPQTRSFEWTRALRLLYLLAVSGLVARFALGVAAFYVNVKKERVSEAGRVRLILNSKRFDTGSFLNYVFIREADLDQEQQKQVLLHETTHVRLLHSVDILFVRVVQAVLWFNPFAWWYQKAIRVNHEFEADQYVASRSDRGDYAELLYVLAIAKNGSVYSHFSMIPLRQRITMLFKAPTSAVKKWLYFLVIPLVGLGCLAFAQRAEVAAPIRAALGDLVFSSIPMRLETAAETKRLPMQPADERVTDTTTFNGFSAIKGTEKLGKHPLVRIDGKFVNASVLSLIDPDCVGASTLWNPDPDFKVWGRNIPDGAIDFDTRSGKIVYLAPEKAAKIAREMRMNASVKFFARFPAENNEDLLILRFRNGRHTVRVGHNQPVGFVIDDGSGERFYPESDSAEVERIVKSAKWISSWGNGYREKGEKINGVDMTDYMLYQFFARQVADTLPAGTTGQKQGQLLKRALDPRGVEISGDDSVVVRKDRSLQYFGNANIVWKNGDRLRADTLLVDGQRRGWTALGEAVFTSIDGSVLKSDRIIYDPEKQSVLLQNIRTLPRD